MHFRSPFHLHPPHTHFFSFACPLYFSPAPHSHCICIHLALSTVTGPLCDNLCSNGGTCGSSGTCVCAAGFTGPSCNAGLCHHAWFLYDTPPYVPSSSQKWCLQLSVHPPVRMEEHVVVPLPMLPVTVPVGTQDPTARTEVYACSQEDSCNH